MFKKFIFGVTATLFLASSFTKVHAVPASHKKEQEEAKKTKKISDGITKKNKMNDESHNSNKTSSKKQNQKLSAPKVCKQAAEYGIKNIIFSMCANSYTQQFVRQGVCAHKEIDINDKKPLFIGGVSPASLYDQCIKDRLAKTNDSGMMGLPVISDIENGKPLPEIKVESLKGKSHQDSGTDPMDSDLVNEPMDIDQVDDPMDIDQVDNQKDMGGKSAESDDDSLSSSKSSKAKEDSLDMEDDASDLNDDSLSSTKSSKKDKINTCHCDCSAQKHNDVAKLDEVEIVKHDKAKKHHEANKPNDVAKLDEVEIAKDNKAEKGDAKKSEAPKQEKNKKKAKKKKQNKNNK